LSNKFRVEVDVWIEEDLSTYLGKVGSTAMLNELAKRKVAHEVKVALNAYDINASVDWVSKSTK
jgi:hypothetical protein